MTDEELALMWFDAREEAQQSEPGAYVTRLRAFARRIAKIEREECAKEAEHWQLISTPEHKCGDYIAAAIRSRSEK